MYGSVIDPPLLKAAFVHTLIYDVILTISPVHSKPENDGLYKSYAAIMAKVIEHYNDLTCDI